MHGLRPALPALMRRQHILQAIDQLVGTGIGRRRGGFGSPGQDRGVVAGGGDGLGRILFLLSIRARKREQRQRGNGRKSFSVFHDISLSALLLKNSYFCAANSSWASCCSFIVWSAEKPISPATVSLRPSDSGSLPVTLPNTSRASR